jgi:predicted 3-demethylubiquinone-9 3-methyltransferase (glyoxalase superfamily)
MQNVSTCLWFDGQALEAATFYVDVLPRSRILETGYYPQDSRHPAGTVITVRFELDGTEFLALNGGPQFKHSPAMSLVAYTDDQEETDRLWDGLLQGGQPSQCGWLTDRFGVSWQVVPRRVIAMLTSGDKAASQRAFAAVMSMVKIDIAAVAEAFGGS